MLKAVKSLFKGATPDEADLRHRIARGQRVARLMDDEDMRSAISEVRDFYVRTMVESAEPDVRDSCWFALAALKDIDSALRVKVDDGTKAAHELSKLEKDR